MDPTIRLRAATLDDLAFLVDCNAAMAHETEHRVLDRSILERGMRGVLERSDRGFYRIAERAGMPIGCLLVTFEWSDWRDGDWWWLQSVYVVPAARRGGVFATMYAHVREQARTAGAVGLRLYVERDNAGAQSTYRRLGMEETAYRLFEAGFAADRR